MNLTLYQEVAEYEQRASDAAKEPETASIPLSSNTEEQAKPLILEPEISQEDDPQPSETVGVQTVLQPPAPAITSLPTITNLPPISAETTISPAPTATTIANEPLVDTIASPIPAPAESAMTIQPPAPAAEDPPQTALLTMPSDSEERERFKAALKQFDRELLPHIESDEFSTWNAVAQHQISTLRDDAVASFAYGDYDPANGLINQASALATDQLDAREAAFETAMRDATDAHSADNYKDAAAQVAAALRLHPSSHEALTLSDEIERLPEIFKLLDSARMAKVENNPQAEITYLNQALILDPSRVELEERVKTLTREIKEREFTSRIAAGIEDVSRRDLDTARTNLSIARLIYPDRQEVDVLAAKVDALSKDLDLELVLREAKSSAESDDWARALGLFAQAKTMQPVNQTAVDGHALAQTITTTQDTLASYLLAPQRLSSPNVSAMAKKAISLARPMETFSPSLVAMTGRLVQEIALYETKIPVQVISDGQTSVAVRGVGRVGVVTSKTISLKPGRYAFEGKRAGYKSVLVWLEISPGQSDVQVSIVCNEQI
jgi:tetratricopeptide (TPR) repeat protein